MRDMAKKAKTDAEFASRTYVTTAIRVRRDSAMYAALVKLSEEGKSRGEYIRDAVIEKLRKEGYYAP